MKRFTATCIDTATRKEMVLSEASYNNACFFVESETKKAGHKVMSVEYNVNTKMTEITISNGVIFCYDEERGYLLK